MSDEPVMVNHGTPETGLAAMGVAADDELIVVLLCARTRVDGEAKARLDELVGRGPDWTRVIELARRHQVVPLVAESLLRLHRDALAAELVDRLTELSRAGAGRNLSLAANLLKVLDRLAAADVPAFAYKGPSLAVQAYGDLRLRSFSDVDVLVPRSAYLRAVEALEADGFESLDYTDGEPRHYLRRKSAHAFGRGDTRLDLQWSSSSMWGLAIEPDDSVWASTETTVLLNREVPAIPIVPLFVFICAHGARHAWDRLKWVGDVAELIRHHPGLDWDAVFATAEEVGADRVVKMGVHLSVALAGVEVPASVADRIRGDEEAVRLSGVAARRFLFGPINEGDPETVAEETRLLAASKERRRDRYRYRSGLLLNPTFDDYDWLTLPGWAWPAYRVLRPLRLLSERLRGRRSGDRR